MLNNLLEAIGFWCVVVAVAVLASPAWALLALGVGLLIYVDGPDLLAGVRRRSDR